MVWNPQLPKKRVELHGVVTVAQQCAGLDWIRCSECGRMEHTLQTVVRQTENGMEISDESFWTAAKWPVERDLRLVCVDCAPLFELAATSYCTRCAAQAQIVRGDGVSFCLRHYIQEKNR